MDVRITGIALIIINYVSCKMLLNVVPKSREEEYPTTSNMVCVTTLNMYTGGDLCNDIHKHHSNLCI